LTAVAGIYDELQKMNVELLAISMDTQFVHMAWDIHELKKMTKDGIPYPMLADNSGKTGAAYGVYDEKIELDVRGTFFIDPEGVVQALEIHTPPLGRNTDELIRRVQGLQYIADKGGAEALPANWQPDKKTLKPGEGLVGSVCEVWDPEKDA
jgi:peroxiredoxin (alkyl hydroperoxide reductase subunit C)